MKITLNLSGIGIIKYLSPDPICSYSVKIRISSISKGLPANYSKDIMSDDFDGIDPPSHLPERTYFYAQMKEILTHIRINNGKKDT